MPSNCGSIIPKTVIMTAGDQTGLIAARSEEEGKALVVALETGDDDQFDAYPNGFVRIAADGSRSYEGVPGELILTDAQGQWYLVKVTPGSELAFLDAVNGDAELRGEHDMVACKQKAD